MSDRVSNNLVIDHAMLLRRWLRDASGCNTAGPDADFTDQLFDQLDREDFAPDDERWLMISRLIDNADHETYWECDAELVARCERDLLPKIHQLRNDFFAIPVADRTRQVAELLDASRFLPLCRANLLALQRGANVRPEDIPRPDDHGLAADLARHICHQFLASPLKWRAELDGILRTHGSASVLSWQWALRRVRRRYPAIAGLLPGYLTRIQDCLHNAVKAQQQVAQRQQNPRKTRSAAGWLIWFAVAFVVQLLFRGGCSFPNGNDTHRRPAAVQPMPIQDYLQRERNFRRSPNFDGIEDSRVDPAFGINELLRSSQRPAAPAGGRVHESGSADSSQESAQAPATPLDGGSK